MADKGEASPNDDNKSPTEESDREETARAIELDLGDDMSRKLENRLGSQNIGSSGSLGDVCSRRDDNPFSFKHFLRRDSQNYQNKGARPKVYDVRPIASMVSDLELQQEDKQGRIVPEYSSALPDFVQDHLVVEQCYLGNAASVNFNVDLDNLPDFANNSSHGRLNLDIGNDHIRNGNGPIPLDFPLRNQVGFPLDLPLSGGSSPIEGRNEVGASKSLPDFLADGAVHTQNSENASSSAPEREVDRLRRELELTRQQLLEQTRRADNLAREVEIARNKEHDYTQNLAKALEQVEENLERSNKKAVMAESTILKLKQEIKSLTSQLNGLRTENRNLRGEEGAAGGPSHYNSSELHSQRLAQELRNAASSAEHSLRQLLTGVDNLRIMASTLENMHRIEESNESFLNLDEDSGPAL